MKEIFFLALHQGGQEIRLQLEDENAGYVSAGEYVIAFPANRGCEVEKVIYDLTNKRVVAQLRGVIYAEAEQYVKDTAYLREHGWVDYEA